MRWLERLCALLQIPWPSADQLQLLPIATPTAGRLDKVRRRS
jgi:hypothetical protein